MAFGLEARMVPPHLADLQIKEIIINISTELYKYFHVIENKMRSKFLKTRISLNYATLNIPQILYLRTGVQLNTNKNMRCHLQK